jgi:hypothetical protein
VENPSSLSRATDAISYEFFLKSSLKKGSIILCRL